MNPCCAPSSPWWESEKFAYYVRGSEESTRYRAATVRERPFPADGEGPIRDEQPA